MLSMKWCLRASGKPGRSANLSFLKTTRVAELRSGARFPPPFERRVGWGSPNLG